MVAALVLNVGAASAGCGSDVTGLEALPLEAPAVASDAVDAAPEVIPSVSVPQPGDVLITGGIGKAGLAIGSTQLYSASTGTFVNTPAMGAARAAHQALIFPAQHEVLIVGGFKGKAKIKGSSMALKITTLATGRIYHTDKGTFGLLKSKMLSAKSDDDRAFFPALTLQSGLGFLPSGLCNGDIRPTAFDFDSGLSTFQLLSNRVVTARAFHTATLLGNGKVLIAGGITTLGGNTTNTAEIFDPSIGSFTATGNMIDSRAGHTATLLPSGKVLIAGGVTSSASTVSSSTFTSLNTAEIFDPTANAGVGAFSAAPNMTAFRWEHTATLVGGTVLIAGGFNGVATWTLAAVGKDSGDAGSWTPTAGSIEDSAEIYDPVANTFTPTTLPMNVARFAHTATLLNSGDVLIVGGFGGVNLGTPLNSTELFTPASGGSFTAGPTLKAPRAWHTATLIQ